MARIHASKGGNLILVARRTEALEALKTELESTYKVQVSTFTQDLTQAHAAKKVYDFVNHSGLEVDYLMNNAGFGGHGEFIDRPLEKDLEMIQLSLPIWEQLLRRL